MWCPRADSNSEMVGLEIDSSFAFQDSGWLGDLAPHLLTATMRQQLISAKAAAARRIELEAQIPTHLLYEKGWPKVMPTVTEARMLADVRRGVAQALGLTIDYTEASAIRARYAELMTQAGYPLVEYRGPAVMQQLQFAV